MTAQNTPDSKQDEALEPCPFCGSASVVWSEHFQRVRCNGCFIGTNTVIEPRMPESHKERCIRDWNSRASVAAVEGDAALVEQVVEAVWRNVKRYEDGEIWMDTLRAKAQVKKLLSAAASSPAPAEPPMCTCLADSNQVAWEYVHHTSDCPVYKAGEVAKQWLLDHPQLKHSRIFAGAAAWDRETVATLLIQYATQHATPAEPPQQTGEQEMLNNSASESH